MRFRVGVGANNCVVYYLLLLFVACYGDDKSHLKIRMTDEAVGRFQAGIKLATVSRGVDELESDSLIKLRQLIEKSFPLVHSSPLVRYEIVSNYSLLYSVRGSNSKLKPYMLLAHLDVVPVEQEHWTVPAFDGLVKDGFIYGRGSIDFKDGVFGILEALEFLLKSGHKPQRSFYIGMGHDEEVMGEGGALAIAKLLQSRNVQLDYLLDEGTFIVKGIMPNIQRPIALVSISEKGYLNVKLSVNIPGGHSSIPETETSIGVLARAIARLESTPQPSMLGRGPEKFLFEGIASEVSFVERFFLSNIWFFTPILNWVLSKKPATSALIRTTTAFTMIQGGYKDNVIPHTAWAVVNHRIHPAQTVAEVVALDRDIIDDDRVQLEVIYAQEPMPVASHKTFGFRAVQRCIESVFRHDNVLVVPGVMIGGTDSKHFGALTTNIYRFSPLLADNSDLKRFHGNDERISLANYEQVINFYYEIFLASDSEEQVKPHSHSSDL